MPNWCYNHLTLSNDDVSKIDALEAILKSKDGQDTDDGSLFQHLRPRPADQADNWYDWNINHWGTKWEVTPNDWSRDGDNTIFVTFDSAWSPPTALYEHLTEEGWIVDAFYEESGMGYVGKYSDGEDEQYEYDFEDDNWRDDLPEDLIEFANLNQHYEDWLEWQEDDNETEVD
jgi:hypothetical protein